jgi:hypothetical protein
VRKVKDLDYELDVRVSVEKSGRKFLERLLSSVYLYILVCSCSLHGPTFVWYTILRRISYLALLGRFTSRLCGVVRHGLNIESLIDPIHDKK